MTGSAQDIENGLACNKLNGLMKIDRKHLNVQATHIIFGLNTFGITFISWKVMICLLVSGPMLKEECKIWFLHQAEYLVWSDDALNHLNNK